MPKGLSEGWKKRINDRAIGREIARTMMELVKDVPPDSDIAMGFIDTVKDILLVEVQQKEQEKREETLEELSKVRVQFGQHKGQRLDEVPRDYLEWLCDQNVHFYDQARLYLNLTKGF